VKFGILPPYGLRVVCDPQWMRGFAEHAEALGFESLYVVEHVVVPSGYAARYPYGPSGRMPLSEDCDIPDPLDLLAYLAAVTDALVLATGILVLPEHNPLVLAKRLATLDALSRGRVRLGVGVGWMREEAEALGIDFASRGRRTDEMIEALRIVWREAEPTFKGEFFRFERARSHPKPVRPGGIPIHIGGHSRAAARRAARLGDGFLPLGLEGPALSARLEELRHFAAAAGRDPAAIELTLSGGLLDRADAKTVSDLAAHGAARVTFATAEPDLQRCKDQMSAFADRVAL
jgi:probable F420-dependent oxidoreductase